MLPVDTYINNLEQNNDVCGCILSCVNEFSALKLTHAENEQSYSSSISTPPSNELILRRSSSGSRQCNDSKEQDPVCYFCELPWSNDNPLHRVHTFHLDCRAQAMRANMTTYCSVCQMTGW